MGQALAAGRTLVPRARPTAPSRPIRLLDVRPRRATMGRRAAAHLRERAGERARGTSARSPATACPSGHVTRTRRTSRDATPGPTSARGRSLPGDNLPLGTCHPDTDVPRRDRSPALPADNLPLGTCPPDTYVPRRSHRAGHHLRGAGSRSPSTAPRRGLTSRAAGCPATGPGSGREARALALRRQSAPRDMSLTGATDRPRRFSRVRRASGWACGPLPICRRSRATKSTAMPKPGQRPARPPRLRGTCGNQQGGCARARRLQGAREPPRCYTGRRP